MTNGNNVVKSPLRRVIPTAYNGYVFGGDPERTDLTKRKEHPQTDDYPMSLPPAQQPRRGHRTAALLTLTAMAFAAFWLGVRLHLPRRFAPHPNPSGPFVTARFFEMGQGCSLLLVSPERHAVLIDAGTTLTEEAALKAALKEAGIGSLNAVIITSCRPQSIGGLPRLLNVMPVRGPVLIPVPIDQFQIQGGRAADLCIDAISRHGLHALLCRDYLEGHPGLLSGGTSLTGRIIPGDPASAEIVRFQDGRTTLVTLANLTPSEQESALSLRGDLSCDALVVPSGGEESAVSHEMLALSSAEDVIVPLSAGAEPASQTLSGLAASDARVLLMSQAQPVILGLAAQSDAIQEIRMKKPAAN